MKDLSPELKEHLLQSKECFDQYCIENNIKDKEEFLDNIREDVLMNNEEEDD